ncbi:MAG: UDP-N-acetylmuramate--L-alanine ligase [Alphaproteobacteria bacterium]
MNFKQLDIGVIHFVGIGGIGMSGIAEIMHNMGYKVQGSDVSRNNNVIRLEKLGIKIFIEQTADNIKDAEILVISSAIKDDNPEVIAARKKLIPILGRADMLAELMRLKASVAIAGTHGKTTTTSLVAALFDRAGLDPTIVNGGIINSFASNARLGSGNWLIAEADESDGSFTKLPATIAVVTNIDPEHMDFYGDFDNLKSAFTSFIKNVPLHGFACLCIDHPVVQSLIPEMSEHRIITYGFSPQANVRAIDVEQTSKGSTYNIIISDNNSENSLFLRDVFLPIPGKHNVLNSLAAIAIAHKLDFDMKLVKDALSKFSGVKRRFTKTGETNGISIIDDYGHHPTEIMATLKAARSVTENKVIAVWQPHRYSRVKNLFDDFCKCFNDADTVIITDIYKAGETETFNLSKHELAKGLTAHGHRNVIVLEDENNLAKIINENAQKGDFVICLGAGSITYLAEKLPQQIEDLSKN